MRLFVFGIAVCILSPLATAQSNIRLVDFKNFSYPLKDHLLGHDALKWLSMQPEGSQGLRMIHLKDGEDLTKVSSIQIHGQEYAQFEGFTLKSVAFADVTGSGKEDAIVVLLYQTGGTQTTNFVYIYTFYAGKPKLLAYCRTGDRAYSGLYKVYGGQGKLTFELFDPEKREGDCCSSRFVRRQYRWDGGKFVAVGIPVSGSVQKQ